MDTEVRQIDVEHVLHDALDTVCKYVDGIDLLNMTKVCKSWRYAALRKKDKSYFIQQLRLPLKIDELAKKIDKIPAASLFIYDSTLKLPEEYDWWRPNSKSLEKELLIALTNQLPQRTVIFKVDKYVPSEDTEFRDIEEECDIQPTGQNDVVGLFMSNVEHRVRVHIAWSDLDSRNWTNGVYNHQVIRTEVNRLVDELDLHNREYPKSTIVWFSLVGTKHYHIVENLQSRVRLNNKTVDWVSIFGRKLAADYCDYEIHGSVRKLSAFLRISSLTVETWSTFIHYRAQCCEIDRKIQILKDQVKRKLHYTGLIFSYRCVDPDCNHSGHPCGNSREMMSKLKLAFPYIRFMAFFLDCNSSLYCPSISFPDESTENNNLNSK